MKRVLVPTAGPTDWRKLLADPDKQWVRAASAFETAVSWERAQMSERGVPTEVANLLDQHRELAQAKLLIALPEHKVALQGRGRPSQSDVWALLRAGQNLVSMAVEGKAGEPFASSIGDWLKEASEGKKARLEYLCGLLDIPHPPSTLLRYQLFHRTASALLEAERFGAPFAVMVVQSFRSDPNSWADFVAFCTEIGLSAVEGQLAEARQCGGRRLFVGWASCAPANDGVVASVV